MWADGEDSLNFFMKLTHSACPSMERLKQPSLSYARLSAPHCSTIASGRYTSITLLMVDWKSRTKSSSAMPSFSGTFTL